MSNSSLISYTKISPNRTSPRKKPIRKITIHHMAGNLTVEQCGAVFAPTSRKASSNYGIGTDGRIGMYVEEKDRAWTSSSPDNDNQAVTIEVANNGGAPDWPVSAKAYAALLDLVTDICKRNGIQRLNFTGDKTGNLTMHCYFKSTLCPGPYLKSKFPYIASEVNKRLSAEATPEPFIVQITASSLNVRKGPGTSYAVAQTVRKGQVFTIVQQQGGWGKLKSGAGWISLKYTARK